MHASIPGTGHKMERRLHDAHPIRRFVSDYRWIHIGIGVTGNLLFLVGSVLFLWDSTQRAGVWLFIVGAAFMLVGSAGSAVVSLRPVQRRASNE